MVTLLYFIIGFITMGLFRYIGVFLIDHHEKGYTLAIVGVLILLLPTISYFSGYISSTESYKKQLVYSNIAKYKVKNDGTVYLMPIDTTNIKLTEYLKGL